MPLAVNHHGPFVARQFHLIFRPANLLARDRGYQGALSALHAPASLHGSLCKEPANVFQHSLATSSLLIIAALVAVYIVLGILYESCHVTDHRILSTLSSAGVGAVLALVDFHTGFPA